MGGKKAYFSIVLFMNLYMTKEIVAQGMKKSVTITNNKTLGFIRWREASGGSQIQSILKNKKTNISARVRTQPTMIDRKKLITSFINKFSLCIYSTIN